MSMNTKSDTVCVIKRGTETAILKVRRNINVPVSDPENSERGGLNISGESPTHSLPTTH